MWNKSFVIIVFASFFLSCVALWRASVGPSAERLMDTILTEMNKKPEVVAKITIEGMRTLQKDQEEKEKKKKIQKIKARKSELMNDSISPFMGNPKGDVTILVFFDYHCGFCRSAFQPLEQLVERDKNVKVIFKEYPIFGDYTLSKAAVAAHKQGKYKDFYTIFMKSDGHFTQESVMDIARKLKMDVKRFAKDMNGQKIMSEIKGNMKLGQSLGISATPTFVFGQNIIPGAIPLADLEKEVRAERMQKE